MSSAKSTEVVGTPMQGEVQRGVDFNLKKEDLMLLILEGRKEVMEDEIAKLQNTSTELTKQLREKQEKFNSKVKTLCLKTLNTEAKKIASGFKQRDDQDEKLEKVFNLVLSQETDSHEYTRFVSSSISESRGSVYIKSQKAASTNITLYNNVQISIPISLHGKTFVSKDKLFKRSEQRACGEYAQNFKLVDEPLDIEFQKTLPEYIATLKVVQELNANESLLSDILAEYDLFNRNQPRAKAKMIKEVLNRDASGQLLLNDIIRAASGVRLLAPENKEK